MAIRAGILGYAVSNLEFDDDKSVEDLVFYTVRDALKNTGLEIGDIDTVIQAGDDVMDGIAINHVYTVEPAGSFLKEESKVERDGAWAVQYALTRLLTGKFETAMVVGFSKSSQCSPSAFSGMIADPFYLRPVGVELTTAGAIQAQYYMQAANLEEKDLAEIARRNRKNGRGNDRAFGAGDYSAEDVLASDPVATPLRKLSVPTEADGCAVMILSTEKRAAKSDQPVSFITGVGYASDAYYPTYRNLTKLESAEVAARACYKMSGWKADQADVLELYSMFPHQELMLLESIGLAEEYQGKNMLEQTDLGGRFPVNPSGGVLCAHPIYASGLIRMIECHRQLTNQAGANQVSGAKKALAHAQGGLAMQNNIFYSLEA